MGVEREFGSVCEFWMFLVLGFWGSFEKVFNVFWNVLGRGSGI